MSKSDTPAAPDLVVLFDGVCNLCNGSVKFIIRRDPRARFKFTALQSDVGRELLDRFALPDDLATMILIRGDEVFSRSGAALRIAAKLRWPWPVLAAFLVVPRPVRDWFYNRLANNRYKWFGKSETCRVPTAEERGRFL